MLTLRGGPELVAHWAQLGSIIELVAGVALAGVGTGISVLVAQALWEDRQRGLFRDSLGLGLTVSVPAMLAVAAGLLVFPELLAGGLAPSVVLVAAAAGCIAVAPGMLNGYWLGQQRRSRMLALAVASALAPLAAAAGAPQPQLLTAIAVAQALPALVVPFVLAAKPVDVRTLPERKHDARALKRYVAPGLVIGVLTPLAMVAARGIVAAEMSWHEVGFLQALWRVSDWVASLAGGVMAVQFLPRLATAYGTGRFRGEMKRAALATILPAAVALAVLGAMQRPVFELFYDANFRMSGAVVALFFAGTLARIASWLPLYALYAMRRTWAIAVGEFLSLPLFAVLLALFPHRLTLESAGALWLASYLAYGLFNLWAVRRLA